MNKRDRQVDDFVGRMRELLAASTDDVITNMRKVTEEMLGPAEEHECWFEWNGLPDCGSQLQPAFRLRCVVCKNSEYLTHREFDTMYNTMRHLDEILLTNVAAGITLRLGPSEGSDYADRLRAAAAAMRKSASK